MSQPSHTPQEPPCAPPPSPQQAEQAPAFNAPLPVLLTIAVFVLVHLWRTQWLTPQADERLLATFALIPALYDAWWHGAPLQRLPADGLSLLLAPFGHFFLHANWPHVIMNSLWLLVFGTPVARRLGTPRFLALALLSAAIGALAFVLLHWGANTMLLGASGGVSGLMGAAVRLIYAHNLPLTVGLRCDMRRVRPLTFMQALSLPGPRQFVLVWIGINLVISFIGLGAGSGMERIAGDVHIAGFFAGMALLGPLDHSRA